MGDNCAMTNVLFICGKARKRSPTAAAIAASEFGLPTDFAGLSTDADERLNAEHLAWADMIVVMEKRQLMRLKRQAGMSLKARKLVWLDIPDTFGFMQAELVDLLKRRLARVIT